MIALALAAFLLAATPSFVIRGDHSVGGLPLAGTKAQAVAIFGPPTTVRVHKPYECFVSWRRYGLSVDFFAFEGAPCATGGALTLTVTGTRWQTEKGLRIGDSVSRLRTRYPGAKLRARLGPQSGWWLVVRHACREVGGQAFPGLLARTLSGRVSAFVVSGSVCE